MSGVCAYVFTKNPLQYLHEKGKEKNLKVEVPKNPSLKNMPKETLDLLAYSLELALYDFLKEEEQRIKTRVVNVNRF